MRHSKKIKVSTSRDGNKTKTKKIPSSAPHCLALVALLEFDGRRWYHQKEHRLALLLVPHFCPYNRCERRYSHSPVVKLEGNWGCQWGWVTLVVINCCHRRSGACIPFLLWHYVGYIHFSSLVIDKYYQYLILLFVNRVMLLQEWFTLMMMRQAQ